MADGAASGSVRARSAWSLGAELNGRFCPELEAWILGFGEQAEVIAPAKLREKIASHASAMDRAYGVGRVVPGPTLRKATGAHAVGERRRPKARA